MASGPDGPDRLIFLHGFTQTHHHWHRCARLVATGFEHRPTPRFVDLPGHGLASHDRSTIDEAARDLPALAGCGTYVGYSMGGRIALTAAAMGDPAIERLVLIGATPGIVDDHERTERVAADEARATRIETIGVDAFVAEWLAAPLFATLPPEAAGIEARLRNTAEGLAHSLRACGTGRQRPLWNELSKIRVPVLVIAGALDHKFTEIGRQMTAALADATFVSIAGAGHAAQAERPEATAGAIVDWLHGK